MAWDGFRNGLHMVEAGPTNDCTIHHITAILRLIIELSCQANDLVGSKKHDTEHEVYHKVIT